MNHLYLQPCDIFLTRGGSIFACGIRWATREGREEPTQVNHVGAIVNAAPLRSAMAIEALERVEFHSFASKYADTDHQVVIFRPVNMTEEQKFGVRYYLHHAVGAKYGYGKIVLHLLRRLTRWKGWLRFQTDRWPICSYLIAKAWKSQGLDFGIDANLATPDDIYDFCVENPDKYMLVYPLQPLTSE